MRGYYLVLLFCISNVLALQISEVYYDPPGDDNNREFVELFMNKSVNLTNYTIADSSSNDTLIMAKYVNSSFALIVEDGFDYSTLNCTIYMVGSTIGNNLNNEMDDVKLYYNSTLLTQMSYNQKIEGNLSLNLYNYSWILAPPSPCMPLNIEIKNQSDTCDFSLSIVADKILYENEAIRFRHITQPRAENFTISYWIEDLYGNVVKKLTETSNTNQKSFTSKDKGINAYQIFSSVKIFDCNDTNMSNNNASYLFIHKSDEVMTCPQCPECKEKKCPSCSCPSCPPCSIPEQPELETSIRILNIELNETLNVSLLVTKGSTRKKAVYIYAKDGTRYVTDKKSIHVEGKNVIAEINESLELKYRPRNLTLYVEGLDLSLNKSLYTQSTPISINYNIENKSDNPITSSVVYQSDDEKRKSYLPFIFLGISVLVNIVLAFNNKNLFK